MVENSCIKAKQATFDRGKENLFLVVVMVWTFLCFLPTLNCFFVVDDFYWLFFYSAQQKGSFLQKIAHFFFNIHFDGFYRPVVNIFFLVDSTIWGAAPLGYHLTNTLFHLANTLLVYYWLKLLLNKKDTALLASAIFALHPMHTNAITYVSGRTELIFSFFFFLSLYSVTRYIFYGGKKNIALSFFWYFLAQFSKESALVIMPLTLFLPFFMKKVVRGESAAEIMNWPARVKSALMGFVCIFLFYMGWRQLFIGAPVNKYGQSLGLESLVRFFYGFFLLFFPVNVQNFGLPSMDDAGAVVLISILIVAVVFFSVFALFLYRILKNDRESLLVIVFFLLWSSISFFPIILMSGDRYGYLPSVGTSVIMSVVLFVFYDRMGERIKGKWLKSVFYTSIVFMLLFFSVRIIDRNSIYNRVGNISKDIIHSIGREFPEKKDDSVVYVFNLPKTWVRDQETWLLPLYPGTLKYAVPALLGDNFKVYIRNSDKREDLVGFLREHYIDRFIQNKKAVRIMEFEEGKLVNRTGYYLDLLNKH